jgi:hypothetical protein
VRPEGVGLPVVEGRCANGHPVPGTMAWLLDLDFPAHQSVGGKCPTCGATVVVLAGHYEPQADGIWRRIGDAA